MFGILSKELGRLKRPLEQYLEFCSLTVTCSLRNNTYAVRWFCLCCFPICRLFHKRLFHDGIAI